MKASEILNTEYFSYYKQYVDLVDDFPLLKAFRVGLTSTSKFFESLPQEKLLYQYAEGKWTPKEILLHLIDTERVFYYRALYFARHAGSSLEGFDENVFAANGGANKRALDDLIKEYVSTRNYTIDLFTSLNNETLRNGGIANGNPLSVRSIAFIICGHEIHHRRIIEERYL